MNVPLVGKYGNGSYAVIDDEDYHKVADIVWTVNSEGYVVSNFGLRLHVMLMDPPQGLVVDHINHDKLDNRKANLRVCSVRENNENRLKRKSSKDCDLPENIYRYYIGKMHRGYKFYCTRNGKTFQKSGFKTVKEAVIYRDQFLKQLRFA